MGEIQDHVLNDTQSTDSHYMNVYSLDQGQVHTTRNHQFLQRCKITRQCQSVVLGLTKFMGHSDQPYPRSGSESGTTHQLTHHVHDLDQCQVQPTD